MGMMLPENKMIKKALADLRKRGLITSVWIYDLETGESIKKWIVTDKAKEILNGIGRAEK